MSRELRFSLITTMATSFPTEDLSYLFPGIDAQIAHTQRLWFEGHALGVQPRSRIQTRVDLLFQHDMYRNGYRAGRYAVGGTTYEP